MADGPATIAVIQARLEAWPTWWNCRIAITLQRLLVSAPAIQASHMRWRNSRQEQLNNTQAIVIFRPLRGHKLRTTLLSNGPIPQLLTCKRNDSKGSRDHSIFRLCRSYSPVACLCIDLQDCFTTHGRVVANAVSQALHSLLSRHAFVSAC